RAAARRAAAVPAPRGGPCAGARRCRRRLPRPEPDGMTDVIDLTAAQAIAAIERGDLDRRELFDAYRDRANADELNAYLWVADAPQTNGGPLSGVPLAVKALFCTEGVPSQAGSRILEDYRPPYTATVVKQLLQAGAPLLGKTNQDEFAMGSSNENSAYG